MNLLTKRTRCILGMLSAVIGAVVIFYCIYFRGHNVYPHVPVEAHTIKHIDWERIKPVNEEVLALNPLRNAAGLIEVRRNWKTAPSSLLICDGPAISLILNPQNIPVKVISTGSGWALPDPNNPITREYDVVDYKLGGQAATWIGKPETLYIVETFQDNVLNGPTQYFSKTGEKICQCVFVKGKPWTGRSLQRDGFNSICSDTSYKDGQLDGIEKIYEKGQLSRLRTFKDGITDGLHQSYHKGRLRGESTYENGVLRHFRSWHQNGVLQEDTKYNHKGKLDGVRKMWDESGQLKLEEHYESGKEHGRRWWKGHSSEGVWFWKGKSLGTGDRGKTEFERRESKK